MSILFTPRSALAAPAPDPQTRARANNVTESAALASSRNWIVSDLDLPTSGSRTFDISGKAWVAGYVIVLDSEAFTAPPSATSTVYLGLVRDGNGDVTDVTLATTAHASGDYVVLGAVTTDGSNVTVRDYDNRSPSTQVDPITAAGVSYDPAASGLAATDVQDAIDELAARPVGVTSAFGRSGDVVATAGDYDADQIDYDNGASGLAATDVQDAIDELAAKPAGSIVLVGFVGQNVPVEANSVYLLEVVCVSVPDVNMNFTISAPTGTTSIGYVEQITPIGSSGTVLVRGARNVSILSYTVQGGSTSTSVKAYGKLETSGTAGNLNLSVTAMDSYSYIKVTKQ